MPEKIIETDRWPFVPAKTFKRYEGKRPVRLIVIHSMEAPEKGNTAENVARYFQTARVSAHLCIDADSIVQCVKDNDIAAAAPGANTDGLQLELAGYAKQSATEWLDPYGILLVNNAANATAQYCLKYGIPIRWLTDEQLRVSDIKGIVTHAQVSRVFKRSSHTDPGANFPKAFFLERVRHYFDERKNRNP